MRPSRPLSSQTLPCQQGKYKLCSAYCTHFLQHLQPQTFYAHDGIDARLEIIKKLAPLGIYLDEEINEKIASYKDIHEGKISTNESKVDVYVLPTNEEIMIIKDTYDIVNK